MRFKKLFFTFFIILFLSCYGLVPSASSWWNPYLIGALAEFEPTDLAGCVLWLRSDLGITKDGSDFVGTWADQSGNGNDVTQVNVGNKPLWVDSIINTHPALQFDASDWLVSAAVAINQPSTTFVVLKDSVSGDRTIIDGITSNTGRLFDSGAGILYQYAGGFGSNTVLIADTWYVISSILNGASSNIWKNGALGTSGNPGAGNMDGITVGALGSGAGSFWLGYAVEILIYNSSLSDANRVLVENYLNGRYAIYSVMGISIKIIPIIMASNLILLVLAKRKKFNIRKVRWKDFDIRKAA